MTTLTQAVAIGDNQIYIDAALAAGQVPGYVKIDDELLNVGGQDNLAGTTLVLASPAQEAHDSGATVTYAGRPYDPTFKTALAGAGGEQTIRLLGPFTIEHDTPDLDDGFPTVAFLGSELLVEGTIVQEVFIILTEEWAGASTAHLLVGAGDPDDISNTGNDSIQLKVRDSGNPEPVQAQPWTYNPTLNAGTVVVNRAGVLVAIDGSRLYAYIDNGGGSGIVSTTGIAKIYALIAEPAA